MSTFPKLSDGGFVHIDTEKVIWRVACCDCGCVHHFDFDIVEKGPMVKITVHRNNRATAQLRRHSFGALQQDHTGDAYIMHKKAIAKPAEQVSKK